MKKVICCGNLFSPQKRKFVERQNVYIDGERIVKIETGALDPEYTEVIDLSDKYVLPGMIDAHLHTCLSGGTQDMNNIGYWSDGDFTVKGLVNAQQDLMAGFTTIRDQGSTGFSDVALRNAINKGLVWGPRIFASGYTLTATGGHGDTHFEHNISNIKGIGMVCDSPDECVKNARFMLKHGADQLKVMSTGGVMSQGDDVGAPEFTLEELKAICAFAKGKGKITAAHAHAGEGIKLAVKAGITSIEHGTLADEEAHKLMLEYGTYLVPTLTAGYNIFHNGVENGVPQFMVDKVKLVLESHFITFRRAYEWGIPIAFGTDCGTPFTFHGKQTQEFELMVQAGCRPADAIAMATQNGAELLRMQKDIGSVEAGKYADIIAVDNNPLDDISELKDVTFVMKSGTVYKS